MNETRLPKNKHRDPTKFWFKFVEFQQENWALMEEDNGKYILYFFDATKGVFDFIEYDTEIVLRKELMYNSFERYEKEAFQMEIPEGEFYVSEQAHRRIYSSGKFWKRLPERLIEKYGEKK